MSPTSFRKANSHHLLTPLFFHRLMQRPTVWCEAPTILPIILSLRGLSFFNLIISTNCLLFFMIISNIGGRTLLPLRVKNTTVSLAFLLGPTTLNLSARKSTISEEASKRQLWGFFVRPSKYNLKLSYWRDCVANQSAISLINTNFPRLFTMVKVFTGNVFLTMAFRIASILRYPKAFLSFSPDIKGEPYNSNKSFSNARANSSISAFVS